LLVEYTEVLSPAARLVPSGSVQMKVSGAGFPPITPTVSSIIPPFPGDIVPVITGSLTVSVISGITKLMFG